MKNKINIIGIALIFAFLTISCSDDFLNVEVKNYQTSDNYYKDQNSAIAATNSCYDAIKGTGLFGQNFQYFFYPADDRLKFETSYMEQMLYTATDPGIGGNSIDFALWDYCYRGIFRCNMALEKIPGIEFSTENPTGFDLKERLLGEAYFFRGVYYFYLEIMFNRPPLILKVLTDPSETFGNATPEEIWNQVELDLKLAIEVLPEKSQYAGDDMGRATKGAAKAMLGKAYLYQQKWDLAKLYLGEVIISGEYSLVQPISQTREDYIAAFQSNFTPKELIAGDNSYPAENNSESVFEIQFNDNTETGFPNGEWSPGYGSDGSLLSTFFGVNGWRNVTPAAASGQIFENAPANFPGALEKDPRYYASLYTTDDTLSTDPASKFYNVPFNPQTHSSPTQEGYGIKKYYWPIHESVAAAPYYDPNNWRLIRYSDVLLMYAEANYHLGGDPFTYINQVRARVGMPATTLAMPEALIHERDVELFGECLRFHDLVRWSLLKDGPWVNPEELVTNYKKGKNEYLPIPQLEIDNNRGKLTQNEGWK